MLRNYYLRIVEVYYPLHADCVVWVFKDFGLAAVWEGFSYPAGLWVFSLLLLRATNLSPEGLSPLRFCLRIGVSYGSERP